MGNHCMKTNARTTLSMGWTNVLRKPTVRFKLIDVKKHVETLKIIKI